MGQVPLCTPPQRTPLSPCGQRTTPRTRKLHTVGVWGSFRPAMEAGREYNPSRVLVVAHWSSQARVVHTPTTLRLPPLRRAYTMPRIMKLRLARDLASALRACQRAGTLGATSNECCTCLPRKNSTSRKHARKCLPFCIVAHTCHTKTNNSKHARNTRTHTHMRARTRV